MLNSEPGREDCSHSISSPLSKETLVKHLLWNSVILHFRDKIGANYQILTLQSLYCVREGAENWKIGKMGMTQAVVIDRYVIILAS